MPEEHVGVIPDGMPFEQAAALPLVALTVLQVGEGAQPQGRRSKP